MVGFFSCVKNEVDPIIKTNIKGKPSAFELEDWKHLVSYHYTNENRLSKITYGAGIGKVTREFLYSNNELIRCKYTRNPESKIIGISTIEFEKKNKYEIRACILFDSNTVAYQTILLNDEELPVRISSNRIDNLIQEESYDHSYNEFMYYPGTKKVHKIMYYTVSKNKVDLIKTHVYEYDNNPGTTGKISCPLWFRIFLTNLHIENLSDKELKNYDNNVIKEEILNNKVPSSIRHIIEYKYTYDDEGYPVSVIEPIHAQKINIIY